MSTSPWDIHTRIPQTQIINREIVVYVSLGAEGLGTRRGRGDLVRVYPECHRAVQKGQKTTAARTVRHPGISNKSLCPAVAPVEGQLRR